MSPCQLSVIAPLCMAHAAPHAHDGRGGGRELAAFSNCSEAQLDFFSLLPVYLSSLSSPQTKRTTSYLVPSLPPSLGSVRSLYVRAVHVRETNLSAAGNKNVIGLGRMDGWMASLV